MKILKNLGKRVSAFKVEEDRFVLVDESNRVIFFSKDLLLKKGFRLKIDSNNPDEKSTKFSRNNLLAITTKNKTFVFNLKEKKFVSKLENRFDILSVAFDEKDRYLAFSDVSNCIYLFNLKLDEISLKLAKHKDFINDIEFCSDFNEVIAGAFDKCVLFVNVVDLEKKERYSHIKSVKKVLEDNYLVSADEISDIIKWDNVKLSLKDRVDFYKEFRDFFIDKEILVILTSRNVILYDLEKEVILNDNFLEVANADKVIVFDRYLIISSLNGILFYYDLFENEKDLLDAILEENFKKAYELIDKNPFLKRSRAYERLEKLVELKIEEAKKYFEIDPLKAESKLSKLLEVPFLREKIQKVINDYSNLIKFKNAVLNNNFALAYRLANQYPLLKETKYYELLEKKWEIALEKAIKYLKEGKKSLAEEVLRPFLAVPEKLELIKFVLNKYELILLLREKLAKRDFKGFFALIKLHPELKNTKEYKKVIEYANRLYERAKEFLEKEEFEKAKKIALVLQDFEGFEDKAEKILREVEISLKFLNFIANKEYEKAIELVKLYPFLKRLKSYKELMQNMKDDFYEAEILVNKNKIGEAEDLLDKYKNRFSQNRIDEILKTKREKG